MQLFPPPSVVLLASSLQRTSSLQYLRVTTLVRFLWPKNKIKIEFSFINLGLMFTTRVLKAFLK